MTIKNIFVIVLFVFSVPQLAVAGKTWNKNVPAPQQAHTKREARKAENRHKVHNTRNPDALAERHARLDAEDARLAAAVVVKGVVMPPDDSQSDDGASDNDA